MLSQIALSLLALGSVTVMAAVAPAGTYKIDPDHSNVGFEVGHLAIGTVVGRFDRFSGEIQFNPRGQSRAVVDIEIASINTKVDQRDSHLRSADFFNVEQFPTMHFESTSVEYDAEGNPKSIVGTLSFHGQSRPVTLAVATLGNGQGPLGETRAGFKASTTIQRTEFGMNGLLAIAGDAVTISINVEGIKL